MTQVSGAQELSRFVTYRISVLNPKLNAQAAAILKKHADLSLVQWRIVFMVHAFGPEISSGAIIERANMDKGLFSRGLKQVIELGLVEGETDPKDQRRILLSLTQKGKAIYERIIVIMRKRQDYLLHNLTDDEIKSVFSALEKLQTNSERINF